MGGRVVEGTGLENRQAGNRLVGSNPTPSATRTKNANAGRRANATGRRERKISELLEALRAFDGKAVSILSEARARFGGSDDFLGELATLVASQEGSVSDGATWLIKNCAESGVVPGPEAVAAIVARLDGVDSWGAVLHLCQTAEYFAFTPDQARRFGEWAAEFLDHKRPFLRAWSMDALQRAARQAPDLAPLAEKALIGAESDSAASVRARARNVRAEIR